MAAEVTLKMSALDHQALVALLKNVAGIFSDDEFEVTMALQGRGSKGTKAAELRPVIAEVLAKAVN